jgi:hypothetical protein
VKTGNQSIRIDVLGRETWIWNNFDRPKFEIYTDSPFVQKMNYSQYNEFRISVYNAMDYKVKLDFSVNESDSTLGNKRVFFLESGWNELRIDIDPLIYSHVHGITNISKFVFYFDRGELHDETEVVYFDNFRAVRTREIPSALSYSVQDGLINGFNDAYSLNYMTTTGFGNGSVEISYGLVDDPALVKEGTSALRIYSAGSQVVRSDIADEFRTGFLPQALCETVDWTQYAGKTLSLDIYNAGEETLNVYVYYFYNTLHTMLTYKSYAVNPGQWVKFSETMVNIAAATYIYGETTAVGDLESWTGIMLGFKIPHPERNMKDVNLIVDNLRLD